MRVPKQLFAFFLRNWIKKFRKLRNTSAWFLLFLLEVTLKIEIWVSKFHSSFFTDIENTNQDTLKFGFNEIKAEIFNLCKSRYQAALVKQRVNHQCAVYKPAGGKIRSICSESSKCIRQKESWWTKKGSYQCGSPVRIVFNFFQMTMLFVTYVRLF